MDYKTIPALAAYIDRIGAEQMNFRRFMVKEFQGKYYKEKVIITLAKDGAVDAPEGYQPTEEEATAIKVALRDIVWPQPIGADNANFLKSKLGKSDLYELWDVKREKIIMCQERAVNKNGEKFYLPWTFFSDGEWRRMEPDGKLPFWKPKNENSLRARIMVHEGAKAAHFADALVNRTRGGIEEHPWFSELAEYEHWGLIGGALAPHRANYDELRAANPTEVVYVCDNDPPGKDVIKEFSRLYGGRTKVVMFDSRWPYAWDIADEMPRNLYGGKGSKRYNGPQLRELMAPATYATEAVPTGGKGRPAIVIRAPFKEEYVHAVRPEVYIHRDWPDRIWSGVEFNNHVKPYSSVDDTARILKSDAANKSCCLKYDPSKPPGIFTDTNEGRFINTHVPSSIRAEQGDVEPWLSFMEHLVPEEADRVELMRWCATLIARPDIKMLYGVLLISERQGVGKTTLGEKILQPLIGENNVSHPSEQEIVDSNFNYWISHKRLAIVNEIYSGHSFKAYNRLKSAITDRSITVSKKFQAHYDIDNWVHILACSNSPRALKLSEDDRRWFVPKVTDEKHSRKFWADLNWWLVEEGGLGKIKFWASQWLETNAAVAKGDDAPTSTLKSEIIEESLSPGQQIAATALARAKETMNGEPVFLLDVDLVGCIRDQLYDGRHNDRLEKAATIRKLAKSRGWFISDHLAMLQEWGTRGIKARMICSSPDLAKEMPLKLKDAGRKPIDPKKLFDY